MVLVGGLLTTVGYQMGAAAKKVQLEAAYLKGVEAAVRYIG